MSARHNGLLMLLAVLLLALSPGRLRAAAPNLHSDSAACLRDYPVEKMSATCLQACVQCHPANAPLKTLDIYRQGDEDLCLLCHPGKTLQKPLNMLLSRIVGGGGNHPSDILYDPYLYHTQLKPDPQGPRLFYDAAGDNPKILCSTCHDSMGDTINLLRISNHGSALCYSCHDI